MLLVILAHVDVTKDFYNKLRIEKEPVLVLFYADWCINYQDFKPIWNSLGHPKVKFMEVDCVFARDICQEERIKGYPTLKYYHDGEAQDMFMGIKDRTNIEDWIRSKAR